MMYKKLLAGAAAAAAVLSAPAAMAGALTGNAGAVSTYLFRGIEQTSTGAAVQGGVDYVVGNGLYAGSWASNNALLGGDELDVYGGYTGALAGFTYDVGGIFYYYSEEEDLNATGAVGNDFNTLEVYAGAGFGPATAKVYFTNDFRGTDESAMYINVAATLAFNDTLSLVPAIGFSSGDGVKLATDALTPAVAGDGDEYADYGVSLVKTMKDDLSASFAVVGTDLDDDDPKFVVGLKKGFKL